MSLIITVLKIWLTIAYNWSNENYVKLLLDWLPFLCVLNEFPNVFFISNRRYRPTLCFSSFSQYFYKKILVNMLERMSIWPNFTIHNFSIFRHEQRHLTISKYLLCYSSQACTDICDLSYQRKGIHRTLRFAQLNQNGNLFMFTWRTTFTF